MKTMTILFLFLLFFSSAGFTQTVENISYDDLMTRCEEGSKQKPFSIQSREIKNPTQKARIQVQCWMENERRLAVSELWVNDKKVYATPLNALAVDVSCGSAAGEVYRPHAWSPDGAYFSFLLVPFCWETEPLQPVVMLYRAKDQKTQAPQFYSIAEAIFKRYPLARKNRKNLEFRAKPLSWESSQKLKLEVEMICYGCTDKKGDSISLPKTHWHITPDGPVFFLGD